MNASEQLDIAIGNALTSRTNEPNFRVFVNGKLDYKAAVSTLNQWDSGSGVPAYEQLRNIVGPAAVLALNDVASWNAGISRELANDHRLLPRDISHDPTLVDTYAFVSSGEGVTPFGAHVDFEHSIILDLAGAGRTINIWPVGAEYGAPISAARGIAGTSFSWDDHSDQSREVPLTPGDLGVIRAGEPHVFRAHGAGMFLGLSMHGTDASQPVTVRAAAHGLPAIPLKDPKILQHLGSNHQFAHCCELTVDPTTQTVQMHGARVKLEIAEFASLGLGNESVISNALPRDAFAKASKLSDQLLVKLGRIGAIIPS
ncbi:hypothetical protein ACX31A_12475 [Dermacoccus nishinomiyaensis]